jgi:hypothetical protein
MTKLDITVVYNIYAVYNNNDVAYYVKDVNEGQHDFALKVFKELKTENTKKFSIIPYGNPEFSDAILEYYKDDDEDDFWVIPKDDIFDK